MTPHQFPEANVTFAKDQPEYQPLPAVVGLFNGEVITCWRPSFWERLKLLWTGRVWVHQLTFGAPLQPLIVSAHKLFIVDPEGRIGIVNDSVATDGATE